MRLTWRTNNPAWVNQWLLPAEKVTALQELVQEQLGHITLTISP